MMGASQDELDELDELGELDELDELGELDEIVPINPYVRAGSLLWLRLKLPFLRRRIRRPCLEYIDDVPLLSVPEVLNPVVFRGGELLARTLATSPWAESPHATAVPRALDMGTGSGVGAIFTARRGYYIIGVDLNLHAVHCARMNVFLNHLEDQIEIRAGDLFAPVAGEQFHLVLFNPPFFRGEPQNEFDMAWRATDVIERFAIGLPGARAPHGRALILLSTDGDAAGMLSALKAQNLRVSPVFRRHFGSEIVTIYMVCLDDLSGSEL